MSLTPGTRLGPYEVVSAIGAGGMGEVYRATDTSLGRQVAIKVLPEAFATDADRLARFEREAKTLAALNHPHIAQIYGLERAGGTPALVMEFVDGETLADRIARGPIPIDEALPIARQIAEALEAAHEQGIIHRDLKPANIKIAPGGGVKVLDFGLSKLNEPNAMDGPNGLTMSPTLSVAFTQAGTILGTAAYMAPEQARGKLVDKRSDVWAFGCVLFEMLTGTRAFDGDDAAVVLASVIKSEPHWSALPPDLPTPIATLLRGCLEKERRNRVSDMGAAIFVVDRHPQLSMRGDSSTVAPRSSRTTRWRFGASIATALFAGALLTGVASWRLMGPATPPIVRMTIPTADRAALAVQGVDRDIAITPDGSHIAYRGNNQIIVRSLSELEPTIVSPGGAPRGLFVSPDGQWVGYFDSAASIKKVAVAGGPPVAIATIDGGGGRGATWGPDGSVVFATNQPETGLQRVPVTGGDPVVLTRPDHTRGEGDHLWPEFLPDGKSLLFTIAPITGTIENAQIALLDMQTLTWKVVLRGGSHAHYMSTGHLIYGAAGTLRAVTFDLNRREVTGAPIPVLTGVMTTAAGAAEVAAAANGSLVYLSGVPGTSPQLTVDVVDRQGRATPVQGIKPDIYRDVSVSPDGTRLALATPDDVWVYDMNRGTLSRLTTDPAQDTRPVWTADGRRIVFTSNRSSSIGLFWRPADGTGTDEQLLTRGNDLLDLRVNDLSPDGKRFLFAAVSPGAQGCDIQEAAFDRPSDVRVLIKNGFCNDWAAVSPDGHWMAYHSFISGREEIYIERYPELGDRQQISTAGGQRPVWSPDGRSLYFLSNDYRQVFVASTESGTTLKVARPQLAFNVTGMVSTGGARPYDIAPDGRIFIIRAQPSQTEVSAPPSLVLVQNWTEELKRLVPAK